MTPYKFQKILPEQVFITVEERWPTEAELWTTRFYRTNAGQDPYSAYHEGRHGWARRYKGS